MKSAWNLNSTFEWFNIYMFINISGHLTNIVSFLLRVYFYFIYKSIFLNLVLFSSLKNPIIFLIIYLIIIFILEIRIFPLIRNNYIINFPPNNNNLFIHSNIYIL